MKVYKLTSLEAIQLFVKANGRVFAYPVVEVVRLRVRDSREAVQLLCAARREGGLDVVNYDRVDRLATGGLMLQAADMIIGDLLREVEERAIDQEHVEGLASNGKFIRQELCSDGLFDFITDVAQVIVSVADNMKPPFHRNYSKIKQSLEMLRVSVNTIRDREVEFSAAAQGPVAVGVSHAQAPVMLLVDDALDAPAAEDTKLEEAAKDDALDAPAAEDAKLEEAAKDDALDAPAAEDAKLEEPAKDDALDTPAAEEAKAKLEEAAKDDKFLDDYAPYAPAPKEAKLEEAAKDDKLLDDDALDAPAPEDAKLDAAAPAQEKAFVLDAAAEGGFVPALKEEEAAAAAAAHGAAGDDIRA